MVCKLSHARPYHGWCRVVFVRPAASSTCVCPVWPQWPRRIHLSDLHHPQRRALCLCLSASPSLPPSHSTVHTPTSLPAASSQHHPLHPTAPLPFFFPSRLSPPPLLSSLHHFQLLSPHSKLLLFPSRPSCFSSSFPTSSVLSFSVHSQLTFSTTASASHWLHHHALPVFFPC